MSTFRPEQFFSTTDIERFSMAAEEAELAWLHQINVERLEAEGVIEALGGVLLRRYESLVKAAADRDEYDFIDDSPYRYDGESERLIISQSVLTSASSRAVRAWITLRTEVEDEGLPRLQYEEVEVARIDEDLPVAKAGFTQDHAWTMKEICEGRELAHKFGVLPHLNAALDGLSSTPEDRLMLPRNIELGGE